MSETRIAMVDLESNYSKFVVDEPSSISNLITDPFEEKMYFKSGIKVKQANFNGSDVEVIHEGGRNPIEIFALDWVEQKMYWINNYMSLPVNGRMAHPILVGDKNFDEEKQIFFAIPAKLVLDPYARLVMLHVRLIHS